MFSTQLDSRRHQDQNLYRPEMSRVKPVEISAQKTFREDLVEYQDAFISHEVKLLF